MKSLTKNSKEKIMNKQEVIDEIKVLHAKAVGRSQVSPHPLYADGVADTCSDVIELLNQLDEPQKVAVPLNKNQQIVLEWLKEVYSDNDEGFFSVVSYLIHPTTEEESQDPAYKALSNLNIFEEAHVLAVFAEWGLIELDQLQK